MFAIITLNTLFIKRRSRFLLLKNKIITLNNKREIIALINIDNKFFFVSQSFIKKTQNFKSEQIFLYKIYNLLFDLANNREKKQKRILKTYIINIQKYDFIFNYF